MATPRARAVALAAGALILAVILGFFTRRGRARGLVSWATKPKKQRSLQKKQYKCKSGTWYSVSEGRCLGASKCKGGKVTENGQCKGGKFDPKHEAGDYRTYDKRAKKGGGDTDEKKDGQEEKKRARTEKRAKEGDLTSKKYLECAKNPANWFEPMCKRVAKQEGLSYNWSKQNLQSALAMATGRAGIAFGEAQEAQKSWCKDTKPTSENERAFCKAMKAY